MVWFEQKYRLPFCRPQKVVLSFLFFVVTASRMWLRGEEIVFFFLVGFRVSALFFLQIFTRYAVNKKIRTLYDNRIPAKLHGKYCWFNLKKSVIAGECK